MSPQSENKVEGICRICNLEMVENGVDIFSNWNGDVVHHECRNKEEAEKSLPVGEQGREIEAYISEVFDVEKADVVRIVITFKEKGHTWMKSYDFKRSEPVSFDALMSRAKEELQRDLAIDSPIKDIISRVGEVTKLNI